MKEYALYKGDEFVMIGTIEEIAKFLDVKIESVKFMTSPTHKKRAEGKANRSILVDLDDDDEECESVEVTI